MDLRGSLAEFFFFPFFFGISLLYQRHSVESSFIIFFFSESDTRKGYPGTRLALATITSGVLVHHSIQNSHQYLLPFFFQFTVLLKTNVKSLSHSKFSKYTTHPLIGCGENKPRQNHPKGTTISREYFAGYQRESQSKQTVTHPESSLISNFSFHTQRRKWQRSYSRLGKPSLSCWKCGTSFILRLRTLDRICVPMAVQWYVTYA